MNTTDPQVVIANLMAFRLARIAQPTTEQMIIAAEIAGAMLYHAEHEGIERWRELRRQTREDLKDEHAGPPSPEKKLSSSSAASFSPGDTP